MGDVADVLKTRLGPAGDKVPTLRMPDWLARVMALFVPRMRTLAPMIGRWHSFSADKARRVLGFSPRPAADTLIDCARSLAAPA